MKTGAANTPGGTRDNSGGAGNSEVPAIPDHTLLRCIGRGSYGEVWLARNVVGTLRAVKVVRRATFERAEHFEREFRGIQRFEPISRSHEGFVDILQIGRNDEAGYFYYVMELADAVDEAAEKVGKWESEKHAPDRTSTASPIDSQTYSPKTLRSLLFPPAHSPTLLPAHPTRLPVSDCVCIGVTLASALAHLHKHGLVHRDIKPSNIIFVGGVPKLADIGLVADTSEARSFVGTVGFIPPEGPGSPQADLYSLGKVLYEISTGQDRQDFPQLPPDLLRGSANAECGTRSAESPRDAPQPIPRSAPRTPHSSPLIELNEVLLRACHKDVHQRYPTADAMLADLELLKRGQSVQRKHAAERRWTMVKRAGLAAAAVVMLLAVLPYVKLGKPSRNSAPPAEAASLVVLPFDSDSPDKADEYVAAQMAEELSSALTRIPGLRVLGRSTAGALKGSTDLGAAARQLKLAAILGGRVRKRGNQLRVSAQLVDPGDDHQFWSENYDRDLSEIFGIQTDIAEKVAEKLNVAVTETVRQRLAMKSTRNLAAYQLYLEGRFWWNKRTPDGLKQAHEQFTQAAERATNYAQAYAGLADCYNLFAEYGLATAKESKPKAREAALRAIELDNSLAEAHAALALFKKEFEWDLDGAEKEFQLAIQLNPNYPTARQWYAQYLSHTGRAQEAMREINNALELDPLSLILNANLGWHLYWSRQYEQAIEQWQKTSKLDPNFAPRPGLGWAYELTGRHEEAVAVWARTLPVSGETAETRAAALDAYAQRGMRGYWEQEIERLKQRFNKGLGVSCAGIAGLCAQLRLDDEAFGWLEKAFEERDPDLTWVNADPLFDGLRTDVRFTALLKRMGLEK